MANVNDLYPSKFIRAADLEGGEWELTITEVNDAEEMNDGNRKPAIYFQEYEKGMIVNKTNAMTIASYYGPDTAGWVGKKIILYPAKVQFNNQMTDAIRVRAPARKSAPPGRRPAPAPRQPAAEYAGMDEDEDPRPIGARK